MRGHPLPNGGQEPRGSPAVRRVLAAEVGRLLRSGAHTGFAVAGDHGSGRTSFLAQVADLTSRQGWRILPLTPVGGPAVPFAAVLDALPEPDVLWRALLTPSLAAAEAQIMLTLTRKLDALHRRGPTLVVVDDAHQLDDQSIAVLHRSAARASIPILLSTDSTHPRSPHLAGLWRSGHLRYLPLPALHTEEVGAVLHHLTGARPSATEVAVAEGMSLGNPLLLTTWTRTRAYLDRPVGGTARWRGRPDALEANLDRALPAYLGLDRADQRALDLLSMAAQVPALALRDLVPAADLGGMERLGIVRSDGFGPLMTFSLRYPLVAVLLQARMSDRRAREIRDLLAEREAGCPGAPTPAPPSSARPGGQADRETRVIALMRAARRHPRNTARDMAALSLQREPGLSAALTLARIQREDGASDDAESTLVRWHQRARTDDLAAHYLSLRVANLHFSLGRTGQAHALLREVRGWQPAAAWRGTIDALEALITCTGGDPLTGLRRAQHLVHHPAVRRELRWQLATLGLPRALCQLGRPIAALRALHENEVPSVADDHPSWLPVVERARACLLAGLSTELVEAEARRWHGQCQEDADDVGEATLGGVLAGIDLRLGHARDALALLRAARRCPVDPFGLRLPMLCDLARAAALLGAPAADAYLGQAAELAGRRSDDLLGRAGLQHARAWHLAMRGRVTDALRVLADAVRLAPRVPALTTRLVYDAIRLGRRDRAALEQLAAGAEHSDSLMEQAQLRHARALLRREAEELYVAATDLAALGLRVESAEAYAQSWAVGDGRRVPGEPPAALRHAKAQFDRCQSRLTPGLISAHLGGLSVREVEVGMLAVRGLSNALIAEELTLSVRTVESHLYRAGARIGVRGRHGLTALIRELAGDRPFLRDDVDGHLMEVAPPSRAPLPRSVTSAP